MTVKVGLTNMIIISSMDTILLLQRSYIKLFTRKNMMDLFLLMNTAGTIALLIASDTHYTTTTTQAAVMNRYFKTVWSLKTILTGQSEDLLVAKQWVFSLASY